MFTMIFDKKCFFRSLKPNRFEILIPNLQSITKTPGISPDTLLIKRGFDYSFIFLARYIDILFLTHLVKSFTSRKEASFAPSLLNDRTEEFKEISMYLA